MKRRNGTILGTLMVLCPLMIVFCIGSTNAYGDEVLCSGNRRVWIYDIDTTTGDRVGPTWEWVQGDSPQIDLGSNAFRSPDECKPIRNGEAILITSSYGGVAIVYRDTKVATFWGFVENAHSADLLPNDRILVAGSTGADKIYLFEEARPKQVLWSDDCYFAHGIVWDEERQVVYALSSSEIKVYELGPDWDTDSPSLTQIDTISMPASGGHDMFPVPNSPNMLISTSSAVWIFNRDTEVFTRHPRIGYVSAVKSVNVHPITSQLMYTKATLVASTYDIEFLDPDFTVHVHHDTDPDPYKIYKVRWNVHEVPPPPAAPTGLAATPGDATVSLDWNDNTEPDLDSYTVYRSTTSGSGYSSIATDVPNSDYIDNTVLNGTTYYYVVTAVDTFSSESNYSSEASATPTGDTTPPVAPTGLIATPSQGSVSLDWNDNTEPDLDRYTVYRSTTSGSGYSAIAADLTTSDYADNSVFGGTTYYYVVTATDASNNESAYSSEVSATPPSAGLVISLYATENSQYLAINTGDDILYADQGSVIPSGQFIIEDAGAYKKLKASNGNYVRANPTDKNLPCDATTTTGGDELLWEWVDIDTDKVRFQSALYVGNYMRVDMNTTEKHVDSTGGTGSWTEFIWAQIGGDPPPAAPTGLAATPGDGTVSLDWNDNTEPDLDDYTVYRSTTSGSGYNAIATDVINSDYVDNTVTNGTTYYYVVTATDTGSNESSYSAEVSATPSGDTTPPAAPTGLAATPGDATVSLDWNNNTEPDFDIYTVYRSTTSGSGYSAIVTDLIDSDYVDNTVTNGTTYYYVVTATDTSDNESGYSNEASATPADTIPPAAPTGLAATPGDATVSLDWNNNTEPDFDIYTVYRSTTSGSGYSAIATDVTNSDYVDNTVTNGTTYYYVVTATDTSSNESGYSNEASATPADTTPPDPPTGLAATAGDGSVDLNWNDNTEPDLDDYTVYRSTTSGSGYSAIATDVTDSDYVDNTVTNGTTYYYVVTATDTNSNESAYSAEASATPVDTTPPAAPTGLAATPGDGTVSLDWNDNTEPDLDDYTVYRSTTSGSGYSAIATDVADSDYVDNNVTNGTTYYYVVTATDTNSNESGYSAEASATPVDTTAPAAPTGLSAIAGDGSVSLDWNDNSEPDLDDYTVYRSLTSGSGYSAIATDVADSNYVDNNVTNGTTYYYVVTATDTSSNESAYSSEASAMPEDTTPPAAPTGLAATPGDATVSLDWNNNTEPDLDSYSVYRSLTSGSGYNVIAWDLANSDYIDNNVTNGTTYYYVVTATDTNNNESGYSAEVSATPNAAVQDPILSPGDFIIAIQTDRTWGKYPAAKAIDGTLTKYYNKVGSGLIVTPDTYGPSVVGSFQITTANDVASRDPASWELYGTNDTIVSAEKSDGTAENWTLIDSGSLSLPSARNTLGPMVPVNNSTQYSSYKIIFPTNKGHSKTQFAEMQFYTP